MYLGQFHFRIWTKIEHFTEIEHAFLFISNTNDNSAFFHHFEKVLSHEPCLKSSRIHKLGWPIWADLLGLIYLGW